jgi:hypothetical protein
MMYQPAERRAELLMRRPYVKQPRRYSVEAVRELNKLWKPKHIKIARTAQAELSRLKARLMDGYSAGRLRFNFVDRCFMKFPALRSA